MTKEQDFTKEIKILSKILDEWLPFKILYDRIPGLSVGLVFKGKLVYAEGFGFADVENEIPAAPGTNYHIASISKTFTAVAIFQLLEQGKLNLDDPVSKHVPWLRKKGKGFEKITIRQVLSHTAGVFRDGTTPHWVDDKFPSSRELKQSVSSKSAVFENLTQFKYSNFGFALLGEVIRKVSGTSYERYVTDNIVSKLGMKNTAPDYTKELRSVATGYSRPIPGQPRETFKHMATKSYAPATGFVSNVNDLSRYLSALSLARGNDKVLDRESKKEVMRKHWQADDDVWYGLGFLLWRVGDRVVVGHDGGFAGFTTQIALDQEHDFGVIVLSNTNDSSAISVGAGIFETFYWLINNKEKYMGGARARGLSKYAGVYRARWNDAVVVDIGSKLLAFIPQAHSPVKGETLLTPKGKHSFVMETAWRFDSPGEIARFSFKKNKREAQGLLWGTMPMERVELEDAK